MKAGLSTPNISAETFYHILIEDSLGCSLFCAFPELWKFSIKNNTIKVSLYFLFLFDNFDQYRSPLMSQAVAILADLFNCSAV